MPIAAVQEFLRNWVSHLLRLSLLICSATIEEFEAIRMNYPKCIGLAILLLSFELSHGQEQMIQKAQLQQMFDSMSESRHMDLSGDLLWGYFFTDADKSRLERVAPILNQLGYSVNPIYLSDKDADDEPDLWWLHVEKIETHTVDTLDATNRRFYEFAEKYDLDSYDGMDVGPVLTLD